MKRKYTRKIKTDLQEIVEIENQTVRHLQSLPSTIFIEAEEAILRYLHKLPCEVLVKNSSTDENGRWIPFDMLWLQFQGRELKFRKPND